MTDYVKDLYEKLLENIGETPELFHYDYFKLEGGEIYYIGNRKPLTTEGKLKSVGMIADILTSKLPKSTSSKLITATWKKGYTGKSGEMARN